MPKQILRNLITCCLISVASWNPSGAVSFVTDPCCCVRSVSRRTAPCHWQPAQQWVLHCVTWTLCLLTTDTTCGFLYKYVCVCLWGRKERIKVTWKQSVANACEHIQTRLYCSAVILSSLRKNKVKETNVLFLGLRVTASACTKDRWCVTCYKFTLHVINMGQ